MSSHIADSGAWHPAVVMIVIASWVLYPYFAPKGWRGWTGAGLIQAFIIALYAEMHRFPLTIYRLVRFFHLARRGVNANLWSTRLGMGDTGLMLCRLIGSLLLFRGIGLFIEGWRELCRAHQAGRLASDGRYALVHHRQYTGLFVGLFGEGVVHWPTIFSVNSFRSSC